MTLSVQVVAFIAFALAVPHLATAATFDVDRTDDNAGASACTVAANDCSLRGAVIKANAEAGDDTIDLPAGTYTRTLAGAENGGLAGDLDVLETLTINGTDATTTIIDAAGLGRVIQGHAGTLTLSNLTLQGGNAEDDSGFGAAGGGIWVIGGAGVLTDVIITGNTGICCGGFYLSSGTSLSGTRVTVSGNTGTSGGAGGGRNDGPLTLTDSTVSGNFHGSHIVGGIFHVTGATLNNTTVSGNQGIALFKVSGANSPINLSNVTIANNGVGIAGNPGLPFNIRNSIFAGNGTDCQAGFQTPTINSQGYNLFQSPANCVIGGDTTGNQLNVDPLLGPLQDNGGPTPTHELLPGSPAIDTANPATPGSGGNACAAGDQRGVPRPQDGNEDTVIVCDIGAYEADAGTPAGNAVEVQPVDTTTGTAPVTVTFDNVTQAGNTSLTTDDEGDPPPAGFNLGNPPTYYDITTSATFSGAVEVCIDYTGVFFGNENKLKLHHFQDGQWVNVTTTHDKPNNIICGSVTSLSPFAVFEEEELCGDGTVDEGEDCDDGNTDDGDCCSNACQFTTHACNDDDACTTGDACSSGSCGGAPLNCNDSNVCTTDSCNPASGCVNTNNTAPCNDGDACTTSDTCSAGSCVGGPPPNCNDGNVCTTDSCNPATGCANTNNTAPCNDGNACTTGDVCGGGTCNGAPRNCNDGNNCTTDSCNPATGCTNTRLTCDGLFAQICGTGDNNTLNGTSGPDIIHGAGGNDTINGGNDNDRICGGDGNDTINGGNGIDRLFGQSGNDTLRGDNGNDRLDGGANTDNCNGGSGSDTGVNCEPFVQ